MKYGIGYLDYSKMPFAYLEVQKPSIWERAKGAMRCAVSSAVHAAGVLLSAFCFAAFVTLFLKSEEIAQLVLMAVN